MTNERFFSSFVKKKTSENCFLHLKKIRHPQDFALITHTAYLSTSIMTSAPSNQQDSSPHSNAETLKLPGAASLYEQLDKLVLVCLRDGRNFFGWLRSFDQYANLILDNTVERLTAEDSYADIPIGIFIIRGENVMLLGEVDEERELKIGASLKEVTEAEIRETLAAIKEDRAAMKRADKLDWPIPEDY